MYEFSTLLLLLAAVAWLAFCVGLFWLFGGFKCVELDQDERRLIEYAGGAMWVFWLGVGYIFGGIKLLEIIAGALATIALAGALVLTIVDVVKGRQSGAGQLLFNLRRMLFEIPVRFLDGL